MNDTHTPPTKPFLQDPSRLQFAFGLVSGLAVLSTVGFFVLLAKVNGQTTSSSKANTNTLAAAPSPTPSAAANTQPAGPVTLPEITKADHIRGKFDAPVTIIEFSDLQCPYCQQIHPTLKRISDEYADQVRWVFKHFPLDSIHPNARPAALAAECAAEQGKFWEFVDACFQNQPLLNTDFYLSTAKSLKLNQSKFKNCLDAQKYASVVTAHAGQGTAAQVSGTPTTFVNGQEVSGAQPYEQLKAVVDAAIAKK